MTSNQRPDLVASAVKFLKDPKVQQSSMSKKIAFLESKGLTSEEIETAIKQANEALPTPATGIQDTSSPGTSTQQPSSTTAITASTPGHAVPMHSQPPAYWPPAYPPPPPPAFSWKDYVLAAVAVTGSGYGLYQFVKNNFPEWIPLPPSKADFEKSEKELANSIAIAKAQINDIHKTTEDIQSTLDKHVTGFSQILEKLEREFEFIKEKEVEREDRTSKLTSDVHLMLEQIPRMMDVTKNTHSSLLTEVQNELISLKGLLNTRKAASPELNLAPTATLKASDLESNGVGGSVEGSATLNSKSSSSLLSTIGNPQQISIPSWQLDSRQKASSMEMSEPSPP